MTSDDHLKQCIDDLIEDIKNNPNGWQMISNNTTLYNVHESITISWNSHWFRKFYNQRIEIEDTHLNATSYTIPKSIFIPMYAAIQSWKIQEEDKQRIRNMNMLIDRTAGLKIKSEMNIT
jgi:hypothetical protein